MVEVLSEVVDVTDKAVDNSATELLVVAGGLVKRAEKSSYITKSAVGLGNVENTSDANKPISIAVQSALDLKFDADESVLSIATSGIHRYRALNSAGDSILAFQAFGNVLDFQAVGNGVTVDKASFISAASSHEVVEVPTGAYLFDGAVTGDTRWIIAKGTTFPELPTVGNNALQDMSRLGGRIFYFWDSATRGGLIIGDPDPWPDTIRNPSMSLAEVAIVSGKGLIGVLGATRSSDDPIANFAAIAVCGIAVNDNITNKEPVWGAYLDVRRDELTGAVLGLEIDVINVATTFDSLNPFTTRSVSSSDLIAIWLSSGGGTGAPGNGDASAAIGIHDNGNKFERGIVFLNGALSATYNEAVSMQYGMRLAWYTSNGLQSYLKGDGAVFSAASDTAGSGNQFDFYRKHANYTDATVSTDEILRINGYAYTGSANYLGAYIQFLQRSAFSGSNARFSVDLSAKNAAGTDVIVTLNGLADNSFHPFATNILELGSATYLWKSVAAGFVIVTDGITAPGATAGVAKLYVDTADGDLKVIFGDGTIKTIVVDT